MPSVSSTSFDQLLGAVDQLVVIHGKLQVGRGRRHEQDALHKAGVVITVAAWQSYVEKVLAEALDVIAADLQRPAAATPRWAMHAFLMRRAGLRTDIKKFNTPNDQNVRELFRNALDFDPWPSWEWHSGPRQWTSLVTRERTNAWVRVRHSVAHGFDLPGDVPWLRNDQGQPRLTLGLLKECRKHFAFLVARTDRAFSDHLNQLHGLPAPW